MPRLKKSLGVVTFATPIPAEFQRWLCYELVNSKQWNPTLIDGGMTRQGWEFKLINKFGKLIWTISWNAVYQKLTVKSAEPKVWIRKGLEFSMGNGKMILDGHTP